MLYDNFFFLINAGRPLLISQELLMIHFPFFDWAKFNKKKNCSTPRTYVLNLLNKGIKKYFITIKIYLRGMTSFDSTREHLLSLEGLNNINFIVQIRENTPVNLIQCL